MESTGTVHAQSFIELGRECNTELPSDIIIEIAEMTFHLHKFPLLKRSGLLRKMITEHHDEIGNECVLHLHDLPGGAKTFELVAKFCYDVKIELNPCNVVALRCAAEHLRMTEDCFEGNLISHAESFLNDVYSSWKDTMKVLESCEDFLPFAEELHITIRCINSLAAKACADQSLFGWPVLVPSSEMSLWNGIHAADKPRLVESDWWYEDVSVLRLPTYKRLILSMESKGMKPENIAGCLVFYSKKYFRGLSRTSSFRDGTNRVHPIALVVAPSEIEQRNLLEELVGLLPSKKGVTSTTFLLRLLRTAMILHASPACRENLEKRIGAQLDEALLDDLLIPNLGYTVENLYDIDCVQRMLEHFVSMNQDGPLPGSPDIVDEAELMESVPSLSPMTVVAKLVDGYLAEVAPDVNLKFSKFQSLAALIPEYVRPLDDGIYRAIDIYLKAHPWLTDSEREELCRIMNCQKLSLEACTHAAQNERLPLRVVVQVLFFEQLRLRTSVAGWFFVSDDANPANGNLILPKDASEEIVGEEKAVSGAVVGLEDMRQRVAELENECMSMKQEIEKLGKPKISWSVICKKLPKLGFGSRSQYHSS